MSLKDATEWEISTPDGERKIYVISNGTYVKIGVSQDPDFRCRTLQTGSPKPLELVYTAFGGFDIEREIHGRLQDHRVFGEWFDVTPEAAWAVIREVCVEF